VTWLSKAYGSTMTISITMHIQGLPAVGKGPEGRQHMPSHSFVKALNVHMKVHEFFHTTVFQ